MDPELVTLASTAAATAITLATTDAWDQARRQLIALWRRFRPEQADAIAVELDQGHREIQNAGPAIEHAITLDWQSLLLRLLAADAAVAGELSRVVTELKELSPPAARGTVSQKAHASGGSTVVQIAGDLHGGIHNRE